MANIPKKNYVSMTFMARKRVRFDSPSFRVAGINDDFNMKIVYDTYFSSGEVELTKSHYYGNVYLYESSNDLKIWDDPFDRLGNLNLTNSKTLYSRACSGYGNDYVERLDNGIYTYLKERVRVEFESDKAFNFAEYNTTWYSVY